MAGKRFHITPTGPKRCTAKFRPCPYSDHYGSEESAIAADRIIKSNNLHRAEIARLQEAHRNPDPKFFSRTSFNLSKNSNSPRTFGLEQDYRHSNLGVRPELYHSMGQWRFSDRSDLDLNVQVMRMTDIDESLARFVGVWRIILKTNRKGLVRHQETKQDLVFDFSTEHAAKRSMLQTHEFFRSAVVMGGIRDDDEADRRAEEMSEAFRNMFNAVESDAAGDFDLFDRGMGYFTKSDGATIRVDEQYNTSAFRAQNFKTFLSEYPGYHSQQPEVEIRVTDKSPRTDASWTIKKESGQWAVEKIYADGRSEIIPVTDSQQALDHVYYHSLAEVNPNNTEEALTKGRYAASLMDGVEKALDENLPVIEEWWNVFHGNKNVDDKKHITNDIYELDHEPKGSTMGKIFETFT